ncbi:UDP-N-acetylmuramoyl-tripeptide--D-alanyl-D-alanine ligase [Demetria terragena]|uniref:UDP-N-acetylmuramoyl-tripeptide--D-alanyl-D- alanine ligase n=1 Tax=Demetria terragena TaxID=63959 RepID=UPI00037CA309|nr:UDP-N-acetylmuramoyl-tripeptide--D-alanyl-D-alanine ligase [Demetria terragena]
MIPLHLAQVAAITGGRLEGPDVLIDGPVVTDSREAAPGSLYVARVGEHADGHDYVGGARAAGAVAVLGTRRVDDIPTVLVDDVQEAFAALARGLVDRAEHLTIVGVTGSSGKTTTKDLLATVLTPHGLTVAPVGSYNSEVGVPLTVCRIDAATRYLVAEMGADGVGHIAYLCRIAPPRIGVVLNVGQAHLQFFGSVDAIAQTKGELVESLPAEGLAVLNADDPKVRAMGSRARSRVVLVGRAPDADIRASDVTLDELGRASFVVHSPAGTAQVQLGGLLGEHHVGNALAVLAVALELGFTLNETVKSLGEARPASRWRMELFDLADGRTVINDAYNANPDSMRAALRTLSQIRQAGRRTWAVLGAMRELGPTSAAEHTGIGQAAVAEGVDRIIAVGDGAQGIYEGALAAGADATKTSWVTGVDDAYALLDNHSTPGDVILLKSSRDSGLRFLGDRIVSDAGQEVDR